MRQFIKNWALPLSILTGAAGYWLCASMPLPEWVGEAGLRIVTTVQPLLIFMMLFITFCKIDTSELHLRPWHAWLLAFQTGMFLLTAWLSTVLPHGWAVVMEGTMLCLICPTATAAAVVTAKLGGSAGRITAYTILINLIVAIAFSAVVPLIHPVPGVDFWYAFGLIITKVFPLLFLPIVAAVAVRRYYPPLPLLFKRHPDLAFNLWIVALALAIGVTVRSIAHSHYPLGAQIGIALGSAVACTVQFAFGRCIGSRDGDAVTAGQALGQKNTVVAIWMGYTFLDPITSIAGGFYSVWHNVFNSWQLYQTRKKTAAVLVLAAFTMVSCTNDALRQAENEAMYERMDSLGAACRYREVLIIGDSLLQRLDENDSLRSEVLNWMGMANFRLGNMDEAVKYQQQCYDMDRRAGAPEILSSDLNQLAAYSLQAGQVELAKDCILEAIKTEEPLERDDVLAIRYGIASEIFMKLGQLEEAESYAMRALEIERKAGRMGKAGIRLSQLAAVWMAAPHCPKTPSQVQEALDEAEKLLREAGNLNSLAIVFCQKGELAQKYGDDAQPFFAEALALSASIGNKFIEKRALHGLLDHHEYAERYAVLSDSLASAEAVKSLNALKGQYETRELQLDNERLSARNRLNMSLIASLIVVLLLLGIITWLLRHSQLAKQKLSREMENVRINFFTNITHEFRTPLTVILGIGRDLEQAPATQTQGRMIVQEGRGLLNLVNQLLDISKIQSQVGTAHWRHGNVIGYVDMIVESLRPIAVRNNIELLFSPAQNEVEMDFVPDYVRKIVRNLVSNALKFTPENGRILIDTHTDGGNLVVRVADNGSGIASKDLEHIFDPFYQAEGSHTAVGTGVGLSLARLLVQAMNGSIVAKSSQKVGTVFIVTLPMKAAPSPALPLDEGEGEEPLVLAIEDAADNNAPSPSQRGRDGEGVVLLIIEDNPNVSSYMAAQLGDSYIIYNERNGADGLKRAEALVPDLIITDLMMPVMGGVELCQRVRQNEILNHIPVIMVTALATDSDRIEGIEAGADAYLCKPFNADELRLQVSRLIEQRRLLREKYQRAMQAGNAEDVEISKADREFLSRLVDTIYALMSSGQKADLTTVASQLNMSVRSFSRKVQAITADSPMLYINRIKVDKAKRLLDSDSNLSLTDVAYRCGFDDPAYFSRIFKQITDLTPTSYKRRVR